MSDTPLIKDRALKIDYINTKVNARLILIIWRHESTFGTNNKSNSLQYYCEQKGLRERQAPYFNEWGYWPKVKMCFNTWKEGINKVDWQLTKYGNMTDEAKLRLYSSGAYGIL